MAVTVPSAVNATSVAAMIKRLYPAARLKSIFDDRKYRALADFKKKDDFEGSHLIVPVEYDHPHVTNTFAKAQADYYATSSVAFALTRVAKYGVARVNAETMRSTRSNAGGFVQVLDREISNMLQTMKKSTAVELYGLSTGHIAEVASVSSATITLKRKSDVWRFAIGMSCLFDDTITGASPRAVTAPEVNAIDYDAGTVTFDDFTTPAVANDYVFVDGAESASATGIAGWITDAAATDTLFGVARSGLPLAGVRVTDTSLSIEESIQECAYRIMVASGGAPNKAYMNPLAFRSLVLEMGTKGTRDFGGKGETGYSSLMVWTAAGGIECVPDVACPENRIYVLNTDSWTIHHLDSFPHLVEDEGLKMLRVSDSDSLELRFRQWWNVGCDAPMQNGVCLITTQI